MRTLRRAAAALGVAGFLAAALRLRSRSEIPRQTGGWTELDLR